MLNKTDGEIKIACFMHVKTKGRTGITLGPQCSSLIEIHLGESS